MQTRNSCHAIRPWIEEMESRLLASVSPDLFGQTTIVTRTELTVDAGVLGQPITFDVKVFGAAQPVGPLELYYHGKVIQNLSFGLGGVVSSHPLLIDSEAIYTAPAGPASAGMFGLGRHAVRVQFVGTESRFYPSSAVAVFRVTRPQFAMQASGVGIATVDAGSGPALQPGQTATVQYTAYFAAGYRPFYSTESQTPDTQSFTVDADPEQVIPGLDAGVLGMQAGETRAIYIPRSLSRGIRGSLPAVQLRGNLVYLVTLVSIS